MNANTLTLTDVYGDDLTVTQTSIGTILFETDIQGGATGELSLDEAADFAAAIENRGDTTLSDAEVTVANGEYVWVGPKADFEFSEENLATLAKVVRSMLPANPCASVPGATPPAVNTENTWNEAILDLAAAHGRTVSFSYEKSGSRTIEKRRLEVEHVLEGRNGVLVVGQDPDRQDVRSFRVDRIVGSVSVDA